MLNELINNTTTKQRGCQASISPPLVEGPGKHPCQDPQVRLVADLSAAAFRTKQTKELALWHCLRAINSWGSGVLSLELAIEGLVYSFGYSQPTAYRHLAKGAGHFWHKYTQNGRSQVKIEGLKKVAEYLDTCLTGDKHFKEVSNTEFSSLKQRKSQIYASIHKPEGVKANPISRQSLEEATGLHKVQQRRYEVASGVHRTPNYAMYESEGEVQPQKQELITKSGRRYEVNKRLGNSFHSKQQPSQKGMLKKASKGLRGSLILAEAPTKGLRRYFPGLKRLLKASKTRYWDSHYLSPKKLIEGRVEWCIVYTI